MRTVAIIGKNFGDEGKGLACASLSHNIKNTLIIKHNGGGQAGHTVEDENGRRFIHHQICSGAQYGAATLFADSFMVDLYKLLEEETNFREVYGFTPVLYAEKNTKITVIDDVIRNMLIESSRGNNRHGSCGMGINECKKRNASGFSLTLEEVNDMTVEELFGRLKFFRLRYSQKDIYKFKSGIQAEYLDMLTDDSILLTYAQYLKDGIKLINLVDATTEWLSTFDQIVFETGQGLLLDEDYEPYAPYLTPSKTGLHNISEFLDNRNMSLDEVIYVTRSYVTRHGNGPLSCEVKKENINPLMEDVTNVDNPWQGSLRYAMHTSIEDFDRPVSDDIESVAVSKSMKHVKKSLLITHLNETNDVVFFDTGNMEINQVIDRLRCEFGYTNVYTSHNKYLIDLLNGV